MDERNWLWVEQKLPLNLQPTRFEPYDYVSVLIDPVLGKTVCFIPIFLNIKKLMALMKAVIYFEHPLFAN